MKYTYKQQLAIKTCGRRMKSKRLRKKLLKYPQRYVRFKSLGDIFDFEYGDILFNFIPESKWLLNSIPKHESNSYHQPVIIGMEHGYGVIDE